MVVGSSRELLPSGCCAGSSSRRAEGGGGECGGGTRVGGRMRESRRGADCAKVMHLALVVIVCVHCQRAVGSMGCCVERSRAGAGSGSGASSALETALVGAAGERNAPGPAAWCGCDGSRGRWEGGSCPATNVRRGFSVGRIGSCSASRTRMPKRTGGGLNVEERLSVQNASALCIATRMAEKGFAQMCL